MVNKLGDRMKGYEDITRTYLMRRTPAIIRLDGKAFSTFTAKFNKPFDDIFMKTMQKTMRYLCSNIQGCVLGYTQSDEITLVLCDYQTLSTSAWFDYNIQKMTSVSASMATFAFNKFFSTEVNTYENILKANVKAESELEDEYNLLKNYKKAIEKGGMFDSRVFSLTKEEVCNCIIWRQKDCSRNSVLSFAQNFYSQKELQGLKCIDIENKLFTEKSIAWSELPENVKYGSCCKKVEAIGEQYIRTKWAILNAPLFVDNRDFINDLLVFSAVVKGKK